MSWLRARARVSPSGVRPEMGRERGRNCGREQEDVSTQSRNSKASQASVRISAVGPLLKHCQEDHIFMGRVFEEVARANESSQNLLW